MAVPLNRFRWDEKSKRITFRLSDEDFKKFEEYCRRKQKSKQAILLEMISERIG